MRRKIILVCEECMSRNYKTEVSTTTSLIRFQCRKYCRKCNKVTVHKETK